MNERCSRGEVAFKMVSGRELDVPYLQIRNAFAVRWGLRSTSKVGCHGVT